MYSEQIASTASSPTLVFLHHGLGSIAQWKTFPADLCQATGLPGLSLDRDGHGRAGPAAARTSRYLEEEAMRLGEYLRTLGMGRVILVGHSDGATIALLHAASGEAPAPAAVVSIAAHLFVEDVTRKGVRCAVDQHRALRARLRRYHGGKADALFWNWAGAWLSPSFDDWDIRHLMSGVRCPVLALQGSDDEYGTEAQVEAIAAHCAGQVSKRLIPGCGHDPHLQAPEAALRIISGWIAGLNLSP
jgi:pimeloyl-ACP methyl ester carboxylesterase